MESALRIIFMGTPDFAVASLKVIVENGIHVVAVVTAPDRPSGRGLKLVPSPVKTYALTQGIDVLQPEKLRDKGFLEQLKGYQADLQVVVAFRMLPEVVWAMPRLGTFNLHASLLPDYRGAAPVNWAVINGETETGVTTFFIEKEIDTGNIIFQEKEPISPDDTAGALYERLMEKGAALVLKTIKAIGAGSYPQIPQRAGTVEKTAPKLYRETCEINWRASRKKVRDFVRGLAPYPAAWTLLNGSFCKIFRVEEVEYNGDGKVGEWVSDGKKYIHFRALDGWLSVEELQLEGKKRMHVEELLRGYRL